MFCGLVASQKNAAEWSSEENLDCLFELRNAVLVKGQRAVLKFSRDGKEAMNLCLLSDSAPNATLKLTVEEDCKFICEGEGAEVHLTGNIIPGGDLGLDELSEEDMSDEDEGSDDEKEDADADQKVVDEETLRAQSLGEQLRKIKGVSTPSTAVTQTPKSSPLASPKQQPAPTPVPKASPKVAPKASPKQQPSVEPEIKPQASNAQPKAQDKAAQPKAQASNAQPKAKAQAQQVQIKANPAAVLKDAKKDETNNQAKDAKSNEKKVEAPESLKRKADAVEVGVKKTLPSGVKIEVVAMGDPKKPQVAKGKKITVKYDGRLAVSGSRFDKGDLTFRAGVGEMIPGFDQGVIGMMVGEKRKIFIPSRLGYGAKGVKPDIPPNADLIFEVTVTKMA